MKLVLETQDLQMYVQEIQELIEFSTPQVHRHILQITQQYMLFFILILHDLSVENMSLNVEIK